MNGAVKHIVNGIYWTCTQFNIDNESSGLVKTASDNVVSMLQVGRVACNPLFKIKI